MGMYERICYFNSKWIRNRNKCEFKSFCWRPNLVKMAWFLPMKTCILYFVTSPKSSGNRCGKWETPDFRLYLPVSRLESDISQIIAKVAISCRLDSPTIKFQIFCIVWATVNMERFLKINWTVYMCDIRQSKSKSIFGTNDIICRAIWRHLSFLPYQFLIFDDVGGWQPRTIFI